MRQLTFGAFWVLAVFGVAAILPGQAAAQKLTHRVSCLYNQAKNNRGSFNIHYHVQFCGSNPKNNYTKRCSDWSKHTIAFRSSRAHNVIRDLWSSDTYMRVRFKQANGKTKTVRMTAAAARSGNVCVPMNSAKFMWNYQARYIDLVKGKP